MKTQKLIPLLDYVLKVQENEPKPKNFSDFGQIPDYKKTGYDLIQNYAKFLSQPLKLSMFVTCDGEGNVLEEPLETDIFLSNDEEEVYEYEVSEYNKAKSNVLFEGFEVKYFNYGGSDVDKNSSFELTNKDVQVCIYKSQPDYFIWNYKTIQDLAKHGLTLTENAVKTING